MAEGVFQFVITPVLISGLITFLYGQRSDGLKASRDFTTKAAESAREDIKKAAELAVEYFATDLSERSLIQEAKILVAERDVKSSLSRMILSGNKKDLAVTIKELKKQRVALLAVLTGGSFQQRVGGVLDTEREAAHIRAIAVEAANIRSTIATLRDQELALLTFGHSVVGIWNKILAWGKTPMGVSASNSPRRARATSKD